MPEIGAEGVAAVDLGRAVEPGEARADRAAGGRGSGGRGGDAGVEDGGDDLPVAGAAAEDAAEGVGDLGLARPRPLGEEGGRRHQHAGRADAALRRAVAEERGLEPGGAAGGEALDGRHLPAGDPGDRGQAGADRAAVDEHGAGAAVAGVAADLGAGQPGIVANHFREPPGRRDLEGDGERR